MIPPILHVYWEGDGPMGWLRWQTLTTWQRLHPDHQIRLSQPKPVGRSGDRTSRVQRSDVYRWVQLLEHGGWWTDLDVLYWRSPTDLIKPDSDRTLWLTGDGADDQPISIGLIAALPGSPDVAAILDEAQRAYGEHDYQAAGARAVAAAGVVAGGIPHRSIYITPPLGVHMARLWRPGAPMPETTHGLHWYGGHPSALAIAPEVEPGAERIRDTPVFEALRRAGSVEV